ncbi:MAG: hypothetical protein HQK81_06425 [Desulfovibrionaceae bacterium]|nr:hypothetical protein [Desulfovibrionaceae bacterium]MBF0513685.1 hypothetical protein [Desulfovibrionaceae bacterium]
MKTSWTTSRDRLFPMNSTFVQLIRNTSAGFYSFINQQCRNHKTVLTCALLLCCVIIGGGYRSQILLSDFQYAKEAVGQNFSMASVYFTNPGLFSPDEFSDTRTDPETYIYQRGGNPKYLYDTPNSSEIGWALILRLILPDSVRGVENVAKHVARWQFIADLSVVILLFLSGLRIAGLLGAFMAGISYAIFKMPMEMSSDIGYYYWTIPFSALSIFFFSCIYRKDLLTTRAKKYFAFFLYGIIIGFAAFVRLYFVFLPIFISPLLLLYERSFKKCILLLLVIALGQSLFIVPEMLYNKINFGKFAFSTRGKWHLFLQGVGLYKNPWGIPDSGEVNLNIWAMAQGAPNIRTDLEGAEKWYRGKYFQMVKERPDIFISHFLSNFAAGLTVSDTNFEFLGLIERDSPAHLLIKIVFPYLVIATLLLSFCFWKEAFWPFAFAVGQGIYLLVSVVTWFGNYPNFIAAYIPVFIFILALSIAIAIKTTWAALMTLIYFRRDTKSEGLNAG